MMVVAVTIGLTWGGRGRAGGWVVVAQMLSRHFLHFLELLHELIATRGGT